MGHILLTLIFEYTKTHRIIILEISVPPKKLKNALKTSVHFVPKIRSSKKSLSEVLYTVRVPVRTYRYSSIYRVRTYRYIRTYPVRVQYKYSKALLLALCCRRVSDQYICTGMTQKKNSKNVRLGSRSFGPHYNIYASWYCTSTDVIIIYLHFFPSGQTHSCWYITVLFIEQRAAKGI